jgi:hypothetical protein
MRSTGVYFASETSWPEGSAVLSVMTPAGEIGEDAIADPTNIAAATVRFQVLPGRCILPHAGS